MAILALWNLSIKSDVWIFVLKFYAYKILIKCICLVNLSFTIEVSAMTVMMSEVSDHPRLLHYIQNLT
jgi:hypothetical protein